MQSNLDNVTAIVGDSTGMQSEQTARSNADAVIASAIATAQRQAADNALQSLICTLHAQVGLILTVLGIPH